MIPVSPQGHSEHREIDHHPHPVVEERFTRDFGLERLWSPGRLEDAQNRHRIGR